MQQANILLIDDERTICKGCRLILSDVGHSVDSCYTGTAGLKSILEGDYDVTLLDIKLPDIDGMEILRTVRDEKPNEIIIMMTGYSTVQNAVKAMKLGAFDYLTKPFSDDELVLAIDRAMEKKRLVRENIYLRKELHDRYGFENIVGRNTKIQRIFDEIRKVAPTDSTVLLNGESGTGKEIFARAIYAHSKRSARQFIAMDCSTLSSSLLESELFGHVKGAFTGASQDKVGLFESAHGGTLFLDDVANLNLETQGKLLRVLELHEYKPVGSSRVKKADVRIIAATNQDLKIMVKDGDFREDLFYRLNVFPIFLPPLRERKDDIPILAYHFLRLFARETGKRVDGFTDDALESLINYRWPGNVRELKNVVERLVIIAENQVLDYQNLSDHWEIKQIQTQDAIPETLEELKSAKQQLLDSQFGQIEKAFLQQALSRAEGNITKAARRVGMQRSNFSALMKKHHMSVAPAKMTPAFGNLKE